MMMMMSSLARSCLNSNKKNHDAPHIMYIVYEHIFHIRVNLNDITPDISVGLYLI